MNDAEIRIRCIEAAAQVPGNPNTLQQAREFYDFVQEGQESAFEGDVTDVIANISPTKTPFLEAGAGALLNVTTAPSKKGSRK